MAAGTGDRRDAVTIYDVARIAGVSPSTVSRALGRPGRLNAATEARIKAAADELGFRPNPIARALPTGRTRTIGMVIPDIANPVFAGLVRGAERATAEFDHTLVLAESAESEEREALAIERMLGGVDGLVLGTTRLSEAEVRALADRKPLVVVARDLVGIRSVSPDVDGGVAALVEHLHALGHRALAYVAGPDRSSANRLRTESLGVHAARLGMTLAVVPSAAPTREAGAAAFDTALATGATAIVAFNDLLAIGLLGAASAAGVAVPGRLSISGFDDIFGSDFTSPPLTTVRTGLGAAAEAATRMLLAGLGGTDDAAPAPGIPTELVVRGTTGPVGPSLVE